MKAEYLEFCFRANVHIELSNSVESWPARFSAGTYFEIRARHIASEQSSLTITTGLRSTSFAQASDIATIKSFFD
jgi:hypothetical protein